MELMKGILSYKGTEYPFLFNQDTLSLFPPNTSVLQKDSEFIFDLLRIPDTDDNEREFIKRIHLLGKNSKGKSVDFLVSEDFTNENGFLSTEVFSYFEFDETSLQYINNSEQASMPQLVDIKNAIRGIYVMGNEINYYLNAQRTFTGTLKYDNSQKYLEAVRVEAAKEEEFSCGSFICGKYSLQGTTQGRYLTGGVPPVRFSM